MPLPTIANAIKMAFVHSVHRQHPDWPFMVCVSSVTRPTADQVLANARQQARDKDVTALRDLMASQWPGWRHQRTGS